MTTTEFLIRSNATYYRVRDPKDLVGQATKITLSRLGIEAGDTIGVKSTGGTFYSGKDTGESAIMSAVFSTGKSLLDPAGGDFSEIVTPARKPSGKPSDLPQDFLVHHDGLGAPSVVHVVVPEGAQYLYVAPFDTQFVDNKDREKDYTAQILTQGDASRATSAEQAVATATGARQAAPDPVEAVESRLADVRASLDRLSGLAEDSELGAKLHGRIEKLIARLDRTELRIEDILDGAKGSIDHELGRLDRLVDKVDDQLAKLGEPTAPPIGEGGTAMSLAGLLTPAHGEG